MKNIEGAVVIGGDKLPSPVQIGLTDLPNIGGASGPPGPPGSGTTDIMQRGLNRWSNNSEQKLGFLSKVKI